MISTYTELKTAIAAWLHRSDLALLAPDFITLAEAKFNRDLRVAEMETRVTATLDEEYEDLPSDYLEMRRLLLTGADGKVLKYVTPDVLTTYNPDSSTGSVHWYTIIGSTIQFSKVPGSLTMEMVYYARIPALSDSNADNWLLEKHPDIYLYGALLEASPYLMNDSRIPVWSAKLTEALSSLMGADARARHSGSLTMRLA